MNRSHFAILAVLGLVGALVSVACAGDTTTNVAGAQQQIGVTVSGHGEVQTTPDIAYFNVGVEVRAATVAQAREGAAKAAERLIASLKTNKVEEKDIKTSGLSIAPQYDYSKNASTPTIVAYVVTNTVEVKVRKLDTLSKVVDDAAAAGGDSVRLQGIRFDVDDNAKALEQARDAAMADAKKKAEQLAKAGGVSLDKPLAITEVQSTSPQPVYLAQEGAKQAADYATPIEPGTTGVTVDVMVIWSLKD